MTPAQFNRALLAIGWSYRHLATRLVCNPEMPRRWGHGTHPVPPPVADWLKALTEAHRALPVPTDWRVNNGY